MPPLGTTDSVVPPASALPLALFFYLLFAPPAGLSPLASAIWLGVMAVLTRAAMTLYHVPHIALGAELTEDFEERSAVVAHRTAFGFRPSKGTSSNSPSTGGLA